MAASAAVPSATSSTAQARLASFVNLCSARGFLYPGSSVYGGLAGVYDYGHLGAAMKKNIRDSWWRSFIQSRADCVGIETPILMNPKVWESTGHVAQFVDPLVECRSCHKRMRADTEIDWNVKKPSCPHCKSSDLTDVKNFNLMFQTHVGASQDSTSRLWLRPETAQGIFTNFVNVQRSTRRSLPFGIGQVGKAFRNEVSPGQFLFRLREFEQMELEYFVAPSGSAAAFEEWTRFTRAWLEDAVGLRKTSLRSRAHGKEELSHYSSATTDIDFAFPFGWGELCGIAHRGSFDLDAHSKGSGTDLAYSDPSSQACKVVPHVIEPSIGLDRLMFAALWDAYVPEEPVPLQPQEKRSLFKFTPAIAPVRYAVLPLTKKDGLVAAAQEISSRLRQSSTSVIDYDDSGSIGKRYRRQDEIGTPECLTVDYQTLSDGTVTVRNRDTCLQERMHWHALLDRHKGSQTAIVTTTTTASGAAARGERQREKDDEGGEGEGEEDQENKKKKGGEKEVRGQDAGLRLA